ncbi:MAG: alpha-L-rhamnosidase C-terminal domain-containing protein [Monoglobaceae bacterium]
MKVNYITTDSSFSPCGIYNFSKTIYLDKAEPYTVNIFTTGRYILKINGKYICEGPCKGHEHIRYYDRVGTDEFVRGENRITVIVMHLHDTNNYTTVYQNPKPEVIFEAKSAGNRIISDLTWECSYDKRYTLCLAEDICFTPPAERVNFNETAEPVGLRTAKGFTAPAAYDFDGGESYLYGIPNGRQLTERPIPMLYPQGEISFTIVKKGENFVELDAGRYVTTKLSFELAGNTAAKIIYAECYSGKNGKGLRDDSTGEIDGCFDVVVTADRDETYCPFTFRAFRFIRIESENIGQSLKAINAKAYHYPFDIQSQFECSDEYFNKMYEISINTMLCCTHETFFDCPYYEQQQYIMDSAIESMVLMRITSDTKMVKKCISSFAASQLPSGLILANYPSVYEQIIPGFSFFWIFMLNDYLEFSKDIEFVKQFIGNIDRIFTYFDSSLSSEGLIKKSRYWDFVDWVPEWAYGEPVSEEGKPITVCNMYYAAALLSAENICLKSGRNGLAQEYREKYNMLAKRISTHCFDYKKGLYTDSPDGGFSVHTIIWAILAELEHSDEAADMLFLDGLYKPGYAMNYYLFRALEKCGKTEQIFEHMDGWKKMIDLHCTTWCENPDNPRSECHGWSCTPLYEISSNILGVKVGFEDEIIIKPIPAELTFAKGRVPTRFGIVFVGWQRCGAEFEIEITAPGGVNKKVILPSGETEEFTDSAASFRCRLRTEK